MLKSISLACFKQHVDRTIEFTPGINAIRAPNGSGKSNILLAIAYALFGSKALPETLDDTVTYGQPLTSLKVVLEFDFAGVDYVISRGKSGAELTFGKERVTGQNETLRYLENLFGVSADMAGKLMLAKQKAVGGALSGGPSVAGRTIEDLAGVDLVDQLITAMSEQTQSGSTAGVEARIELLRAQAVVADPIDVAPLESALTAASQACEASKADLSGVQMQLDALDLAKASQTLAEHERLGHAIDARFMRIGAANTLLAKPLPEAPQPGAVAAVRAKIEAQKDLVNAQAAKAALGPALLTLWDDTRGALDVALAEAKAEVTDAQTVLKEAAGWFSDLQRTDVEQINTYRLALQQLESRLIKETTCALCQKDLADVPEVVTINNALTTQIEALKNAHEREAALLTDSQLEAQLAVVNADKVVKAKADECQALQKVVTLDDAYQIKLARAAAYIEVDNSVVPATFVWIGPTDAPQNFGDELAGLEQAEKVAAAAAVQRAEQQARLAELRAEQDADIAAKDSLDVVSAGSVQARAAGLKAALTTLRNELEAKSDAVHAAHAALKTAMMGNELAAKMVADAQAQLALAEAELVEMQANNALVKKLRGCRPILSDKLWGIILSVTSAYMSQAWGVPTTISRNDNGFRMDGHPISGMSGAQEDVLGLAVRLALTKTFLPSIDFMVLDEVAAACDEQRESSMLGLLNTVGIGQVILVTHSELADSYADRVISL